MRTIDLPPDVFSVVMATGICAVASDENGYRGLSDALAITASAGFIVLAGGLLLRACFGTRELVAQLHDPDVALRLFTATAACEVLGVRWEDDSIVRTTALVGAVATWLLLAPIAIRDVRSRPREDLRAHAHGAWLLSSVATSGLAALIAVSVHRASPWLSGLVVALWLLAIAVYLGVASLILWHLLPRLRANGDVPPDSWILMGALAALVLAGTRVRLALPGGGWGVSASSGLTLFCWIVATAWVPVLLYAEAWQVNHHHGALHFQGAWWSAVFPLGMYSAATAELASIHHLPWMTTVSLVFFWDALAVWLIVALGWLSSRGAHQSR